MTFDEFERASSVMSAVASAAEKYLMTEWGDRKFFRSVKDIWVADDNKICVEADMSFAGVHESEHILLDWSNIVPYFETSNNKIFKKI